MKRDRACRLEGGFPALWPAPWLALWLALCGGVRAASWDEALARAMTPRLGEIDGEIAAIDARLPELPGIPISDQGGTGGFAVLHLAAEPGEDMEYSVTVRWDEPAAVDFIALVPARRYTAAGLDAQFGTPDAFRVELLDAAGEPVAVVAELDGVGSNPVRQGHPFVFELDEPVEASALRVSAQRLRVDDDMEDRFVHAWAEAFVFSGQHNLAGGAAVESRTGTPPPAPWQWRNEYLVDGLTPLGLPELPAGEHRDIGWLSAGRQRADQSARLDLDLGEVREFDAIRLFPAKRPTSDLPSGFGFPRQLNIAVREEPLPRGRVLHSTRREFRNPGHNPVRIPLEPCRGRYLRIEATELWKAFEDYPAFFALSEIEVLSGEENVAAGAKVRTPDGMGNVVATGLRFWSTASLADGFGPDGRLVPAREWLVALGERAGLEERRHALVGESARIHARWRQAGLVAAVVLAALGAFLAVALPIRYRVREKRELQRVRERIAGDLHDEVGSNLGSIQMFADLAEGRSGGSEELKRIQRIAAETVSAVRDIVWLLRPTGGHRIGTVEHLRETGSIMLERLDWKFHANEAAWEFELSDEASRHLFLYYREALHNILRHAKAETAEITVAVDEASFRLVVADDGCGIEAEKLSRSSTLRALRQRAEALAAEFAVETEAGKGTRLELRIPLGRH